MKAVIWTKYGSPDVLQLREVDKPVPKGNEMLIKVHATAVTMGDCEMRTLKFPLWVGLPMRIYVGFIKPKRVTVLGGYMAGEVEMVGKDVKRFSIGDAIFGLTGFSFGSYAEYVCIPENGIVTTKPSNITYVEAAPVALGGLEALHFLSKANIRPGQKVLINGGGGSIGTFAIQIAKHLGTEVTAVDSTGKLDMMRSIGADHVIDYTQEDFTKTGKTYDVILDVVLKSSFSGIIKSLKENGIYLLANPTLFKMIRGAWISRLSSKKVIFEMTNHNTNDLNTLKELIETGKIRSVIDRNYRLEEIIEAHKYVETGEKKGDVVIAVT